MISSLSSSSRERSFFAAAGASPPRTDARSVPQFDRAFSRVIVRTGVAASAAAAIYGDAASAAAICSIFARSVSLGPCFARFAASCAAVRGVAAPTPSAAISWAFCSFMSFDACRSAMKALEAATSAAAALTVSSLCRVLVSFVGSGSGSGASSLSLPLPSGLWVS